MELRRVATYDQSMMRRKESSVTVVPLLNDCSIRFDVGPVNGSRAARFCRGALLAAFFGVIERFADDFFPAAFFGPAIRTPALILRQTAPAELLSRVCQRGRRVFGVSTYEIASSSRSAFNVARRTLVSGASGSVTVTNPALEPLRNPGKTSSTRPPSPAPRRTVLTCLTGSFERLGSTLTMSFTAYLEGRRRAAAGSSLFYALSAALSRN